MTQIRPRIDPDLAAEIQAYGDSLGLSFNATVNMLLRISIRAAVAGAAMTPSEHNPGSTT